MIQARDLAEELRLDAHGGRGLGAVRSNLAALTVRERVDYLSTEVVTPPVDYNEALRRVAGAVEIEEFSVLQGDIVQTSSGYSLGVRLVDQSYIVASSTCDLVPGRRETALLFRMEPLRRSAFSSDADLETRLSKMTLFEPRKSFYLPVLEDDPDTDPLDPDAIVCNVAHLDRICTCANEDLQLATRRASLSLFGWRLFGVIAREMLIREGAGEDLIRTRPEATA